MKTIIIIINILFTISLISCQSKQNPTTKEEQATEEHEESPTSVFLSTEQIKAVDIQLGKVEQKSLADVLKVNGELRVPNQNKAKATTLYPGIIREIYVQPGDFIKKGQRIASITNADYVKMQEDYLNLITESSLAEAEYQRQKELYEGKAGALKNLQRAETEFQALNTRKASLKRQLEMMGIPSSKLSNSNLVTSLNVVAPISGIISNILIQIGSYVDTTTPIVDIIDNRKIHVDLHVYEKDISRFKPGQDLDFFLTNNPNDRHSARVYSTGSSFEDNSKTIIVHAYVTCDKSSLIDGMNITAHIAFDKSTVNAVPTEAIVNDDGRDYIFIAQAHEQESDQTVDTHTQEKEGMTFVRIPVIATKTDIGYTQITLLQEISMDAKIVTKGAFFILGQMDSSETSHDH